MELEDLVISAKNGDNAAYEEILKRFKGFIYKTCREIYIKGYDMEDLIQLGNITLVKAVEKYDSTKYKGFTTYATSAIRNNYFYEIRQKSRYNAESSLNKESEEGLEIIDNLASKENIEEDLLLKESTTALKAAISRLSSEEQELINYVYFSEGKLIDYAKSKNIKYVTIFKFKERILKKLKKMLSY